MAHAEQSADTGKQPTFISAFDLFKPSFAALKRNVPAYTLLFIIPLVISSLGNMFGTEQNADIDDTQMALGALGTILMIVTTPGFLLAQLKSTRNETAEPGDMFKKGLPKLLKMIGLGIVLTVVFAVSFLLLIVPFFFMLRRYILAPYYMMDQNLGVFASMKASAEDSKKYSGAIWGIIGVVFLFVLANLLPVIGWLIYAALIVSYATATAIRYEQIKAANKGSNLQTPIEKVAAAPVA